MNFPIHPEKYRLNAVYGAREIVAYRKQVGRMPGLEAPEGVLFCLERGLPWRMRWRIPINRAGGMNGDVYRLKRSPKEVAIITSFGGGSPMTVELAEEFVVLGARRMILITWGGLLQPELQAGDIILADQAIRDEGASYHYLPPAKYINASAGLVERLEREIQSRGGSCQRGTTWTTDAPYRETAEEVLGYQAEGVKTVEMESAGLFTIGQVRGVETAAVIVGMDSLAQSRWQAPSRLDSILRSLELVYTAAIAVLKE